ncbi:hypothetical protein WJX74_001208 [Apatococcus lobatus]|uniref:Tryptophan synthase beta chain-like PALP domain-containing protein n=1 Tax=Apatococcus lobatus TaxID=904363 RepID=A0AAW1R389_9CHLO
MAGSASILERVAARQWKLPSLPDAPALAQESIRAAKTVYAGAHETPLQPADWLSEACGAFVLLKLENKQATGSFKVRGATHKVLSMSREQLDRGLVTSSSGNHAAAVLHACRSAFLRAGGPEMRPRIFLPQTVSKGKMDSLEQQGADLQLHGTDCIQAETAARAAAEEGGLEYISPYNDLQVAGGQGTIALELMAALPREQLDTVLVPVGGGGLISGIAACLKSADPSIKIIGCQPSASNIMAQSIVAGHVVDAASHDTLSDGTAGGVEPDSITYAACQEYVDEWVSVDEPEIAEAMLQTRHNTHMQIEGAAGVAVASCLKIGKRLQGQHVVIIICGGNVTDTTYSKAEELLAAHHLPAA